MLTGAPALFDQFLMTQRQASLQDVFLTPGFLAIASEYADLGSLRDYMGRCSRQVNLCSRVDPPLCGSTTRYILTSRQLLLTWFSIAVISPQLADSLPAHCLAQYVIRGWQSDGKADAQPHRLALPYARFSRDPTFQQNGTH